MIVGRIINNRLKEAEKARFTNQFASNGIINGAFEGDSMSPNSIIEGARSLSQQSKHLAVPDSYTTPTNSLPRHHRLSDSNSLGNGKKNK